MKELNEEQIRINKVLEHEYNVKDKPLTLFPQKLINYLIDEYSLSGKVLDVMCGRGEHSEAFSRSGLDVWCVDIAESAAQEYKKRNGRLAICDVGKENFPYEDDTFDVTFCKSGIEHVNADHLISEMHRITKPNGKIVILTLDWWYTYRMHYIDHTHGYGSPWMKHSLKLILQTYNFEDITSKNIYYLSFAFKNKLGKAICYLIRNLLPYPYTDNFTNPLWKVIRFSNEVQIIGVGTKKG